MKKDTFAARVVEFNKSLELKTELPPGIGVMNPFRESEFALEISSQFYRKYYNDQKKRHIVLGINPGRFGAGVTGVPFTDTKRMESECGIKVEELHTHEPSSVFVYEFINAYGGAGQFYNDFYINSVSPLGFLKLRDNGKHLNYNYYDSKELQDSVMPFIIKTIRQQLEFGIHREKAFCLGTGKNYKFLKKLNEDYGFLEEIIPLEHPRYVVQYKSKDKQKYIDKFVRLLGSVKG